MTDRARRWMRCQFCHGDLYREFHGKLEAMTPIVASRAGKNYHVECYEKLQRVAWHTKGIL